MRSVQTLTFKKIWHHLRTVQTHRKWVRYYCHHAGIYWRGFKHDLSKYSPTEFFESARYWDGESTPINRIKADKGYSEAWLHHKGRNSHHYEYWMDNFDKGGVALVMPCDDFVEMVCDMLAASVAYHHGDTKHVFNNCRDYWNAHKVRGCAMNSRNQTMMDIVWSDLAYAELYYGIKPYVESPLALLEGNYIQKVWKANYGKDNTDDQRLYRWECD